MTKLVLVLAAAACKASHPIEAKVTEVKPAEAKPTEARPTGPVAEKVVDELAWHFAGNLVRLRAVAVGDRVVVRAALPTGELDLTKPAPLGGLRNELRRGSLGVVFERTTIVGRAPGGAPLLEHHLDLITWGDDVPEVTETWSCAAPACAMPSWESPRVHDDDPIEAGLDRTWFEEGREGCKPPDARDARFLTDYKALCRTALAHMAKCSADREFVGRIAGNPREETQLRTVLAAIGPTCDALARDQLCTSRAQTFAAPLSAYELREIAGAEGCWDAHRARVIHPRRD